MTTERLRTSVEEVTDRQLEVARLVAAGKTNGEIAEALGITLDGAKYHVSELLGRLGLERREDIRAWYRQETRSRRTRWLRALSPLPLLAGVGATVAVAAVIWVALEGGRAEDGARTSTNTPAPTATEVVERPEGVLPAAIAFGDASDLPAALDPVRAAFALRLRAPSLDVVTWERHEWSDGCFDLDFPGGCPLSVSPVPGFRLTLRGAGGEYVLRTDAEGARYRVEAAPPVALGPVVFTWQGGESVECLDVQVSEDGRGAVAGCGEPPTAFALDTTSTGLSGMLEHLLNYRISAVSDMDAAWPERVAVRGREDASGPGIERAALEFGRFLAQEAYGGRTLAAMTLAVSWGDANADVCTSLEVQRYGMAHRECEDPSEPSRIYLAEGALRQFYAWLDQYALFTVEDEAAPRTFMFRGDGPRAPAPDARYPDQETALAIRDWFEGFAQ